MALFKGDVLIAGTNPSGGGGAGGGHVIQDSTGEEFEQRPTLQFIGADVVDDDTNEATQVITPSFREIQGDIPDTNLVCLDGIPIGGIIPYGAPIDTLAEDWLPCLGQAVSRTFYHELFAKYGTTYGTGDGSTTFNLPNYGGRVPVGLDENDTDFDTLGETLGEKRHILTTQEMPKHKHFNGYKFNDGSGSSWSYRVTHGVKEGNTDGTSDGETGGGQAHNNIQPSIVANYIVKAKTSSHTITTSNVMTVHNESDENTYSTNYINSKLDGKLLWTNPNPNNAFGAQSITLSSNDYDVLEIYYYDWVDTNSYKDLLCQKTIKGHSTKLQVQLSANSKGYAGNRRIRYINDTTLQIDDGYRVIDNSTFDNAKANYWNVPVYIVGYKTNLFS